MWKQVLKLFFKKAWPVLLLFLKKYEKEITDIVFKWVTNVMDKKTSSNEGEFQKKAEDATQKAQQATSEEEKVKFTAQAEAFNEALRVLQRQNEELLAELEKTKVEVQEKVAKNTASLRAEDIFKTDEISVLGFNEKQSYLAIEESTKK